VILLDVNLLLYSHNASAREHERASVWLEELLAGIENVGFSWETILAFLRLATAPKLFASPLMLDEATRIVDIG
jgi:uncharacterized protein